MGVRVDVNGCWLWLGSRINSGYGKLGDMLTHRLSYELFVGPIPEGLTIDHLCKVKMCCNPTHLEAVSYKVNNLRYTRGKETCKNGHLRTLENTGTRPNGIIFCRTCTRITDSKRASGWARQRSNKTGPSMALSVTKEK